MHKFIDNIVAFSLKNKFFYIFQYHDSGHCRGDIFQTYTCRCFSRCDEHEK